MASPYLVPQHVQSLPLLISLLPILREGKVADAEVSGL